MKQENQNVSWPGIVVCFVFILLLASAKADAGETTLLSAGSTWKKHYVFFPPKVSVAAAKAAFPTWRGSQVVGGGKAEHRQARGGVNRKAGGRRGRQKRHRNHQQDRQGDKAGDNAEPMDQAIGQTLARGVIGMHVS